MVGPTVLGSCILSHVAFQLSSRRQDGVRMDSCVANEFAGQPLGWPFADFKAAHELLEAFIDDRSVAQGDAVCVFVEQHVEPQACQGGDKLLVLLFFLLLLVFGTRVRTVAYFY